MKAQFLVAATLVILAAPAFASTPVSDPFTRLDQRTQPVPDQFMGNAGLYTAPFGDHLGQNRTDDMRLMEDRSRNNLLPPRMDASGVPDPRL